MAGAAVPMAARAAPPDSSKVYKGKASHYDGGNSGGNCSFPGPPANRLYVALGPAQYAGGAACGSFLDVTGPKGTVRVMVLDRCAGCSDGKIDLSKQAFAKIADLSKGIVSVRYRFVVNPPVTGPLTFRIKRGASRWWFAVQVGNHGNPLRSVAARQAGGDWRKAKRQPDNYWVIDGGLGPGPYDIRVTDIHGNEAVATGIRLKPRKVQRSQVRLYGTAPSAPAPPPLTTRLVGQIVGVDGVCLDVSNGRIDLNFVKTWECNGTPAQIWAADPDGTISVTISPPPEPGIPETACLRPRSGSAEIKLDLVACNPADPNQQWRFENGHIRNVGIERCLAVPNRPDYYGHAVLVATCSDLPGQIWSYPN